MYNEQLLSLPISFAASGDNIVIPAPTDGRRIAVDFISFFPTTAVTLTMKAGAVALSGAMPLDQKQTITWENAMNNQEGVISCPLNTGFIINLGSAVQVSGLIRYRLIGN